jgi:ATP/maltotriose-dependent transcriptional regulator MalT
LSPGATSGLQALIHASEPSPEAVVAALLAALTQAGEVALVLDDYHVLSTQSIHTTIALLLDRCPPNVHLVLASRSDPPLAIARLRARAQVVEIRAADLRFTPAEAAAFLAETMGLHITPETMSVLDERTEGWAAGLQLATLALRDRDDHAGFVASFTGSHRAVADYLSEEVVNQLTATSTIVQTPRRPQLIEPFTNRETEVLRLLAAGNSSREIAEEFVIAISTVQSHIKSIYAKLGVHRRVQAIERARELGLL